MTENQNQLQGKTAESEEQKEPKFSGSFFKFASVMLAMVVAGLAASYLWQTYVSPQARANRQMEEQYRKYQEFEVAYKQAMTNDTYGGKTPQGTLDLFIAALEQNDLELASKYFSLNSVGQQDEKWMDALTEKSERDEINSIILMIERVEPTRGQKSSLEDIYWYSAYNDSGAALYNIKLKLNTYSQVWKIESI